MSHAQTSCVSRLAKSSIGKPILLTQSSFHSQFHLILLGETANAIKKLKICLIGGSVVILEVEYSFPKEEKKQLIDQLGMGSNNLYGGPVLRRLVCTQPDDRLSDAPFVQAHKFFAVIYSILIEKLMTSGEIDAAMHATIVSMVTDMDAQFTSNEYISKRQFLELYKAYIPVIGESHTCVELMSMCNDPSTPSLATLKNEILPALTPLTTSTTSRPEASVHAGAITPAEAGRFMLTREPVGQFVQQPAMASYQYPPTAIAYKPVPLQQTPIGFASRPAEQPSVHTYRPVQMQQPRLVPEGQVDCMAQSKGQKCISCGHYFQPLQADHNICMVCLHTLPILPGETSTGLATAPNPNSNGSGNPNSNGSGNPNSNSGGQRILSWEDLYSTR